ncbi:unnamed protein product [Coccothraustes coccothraustes]
MSQGAGNAVGERGWIQGSSAPAGLCHPGCIRIVKALLGNEARTTARQKTLFCCQGNARKSRRERGLRAQSCSPAAAGETSEFVPGGAEGTEGAGQRLPSP